MTRTFASLDDALAFIDGELTQLSAEVLAAKVLAVTALEGAAGESSHLAARARQTLAHVALVGGDADLNRRIKAQAGEALDAALAAIGVQHPVS